MSLGVKAWRTAARRSARYYSQLVFLTAVLVVSAPAASLASATASVADASGTATANGIVVNTSGIPVAGATVSASSVVPGAAAVTPTTTGTDGRWTLSGLTPNDSYSLQVAAAGYMAYATDWVPPDTQTWTFGPFVLTAVPPPAVWGTVTDAATGKPIAGAVVALLSATGKWQAAGPLGSDEFSGDAVSTVSGADGSFAFQSDELTSGRIYKLYFTPYADPGTTTHGGNGCLYGGGCPLSGYMPAYAGGTSLATATPIDPSASVNYNLALNSYRSVAPISVAGRIVRQVSRRSTVPVPRVIVKLQSRAGTTVATTSTNVNGVYGFDAARGEYRVYIPAFCAARTCYQAEYANGVAAPRLEAPVTAAATLGWLANTPAEGSDVYMTAAANRAAAAVLLWPVVKSPPAWLKIIDYWRSAAGLLQASNDPVTDRNLSRGLQQYARYAAKTPARYRTGQYASPHVENPKSPYYTKLGAAAADADLYFGLTGTAAIEGWLGAPFHATTMFGPSTTTFDQGNWGPTSDLSAGYGAVYDSRPDGPILFPGPGSITNLLLDSRGEDPDPLATCGRGYENGNAGAPLILMNLAKVPSGVTASLDGPSGFSTSANGKLCVEDHHDYRPGSGVLAKLYGKSFFGDDDIFLIPRSPLKPGRYTVTVRRPGQSTISWSFRASPSTGTGQPGL